MKWINRAKYFSITCTGRHSDTPLFMYTKGDVDLEHTKIPSSWGAAYCYKLSDIDKVDYIEPISRMDDLLDDIEQYYPEDTWLTLRIYDKDLECIYKVSESCEDDYGEVRETIVDFLKTGEYQSVKTCYYDGTFEWK